MQFNLKTTLLHSLFLVLSLNVFAQTPDNDNCDGLVDLGVAPYCPDITIPGNETEIYSNVDATATDIGFGNNPTCFNGGTAQRDVWFAFTTSDTIFDYTITVMGVEGPDGEPSIVNPQVALYRGACAFNNLAELFCASAEPGETMIELDAPGLTPNITYFLRINDYSSSGSANAGSFKLCIDEQDPVNTIDEGGSTNCTGVLFDSGGPDGDYGNNENNVFTICPTQPTQCITFGLEYFNIESSDFNVSDQLIFYDGDGTDPNTIISVIGGQGTGETASSGVCYEVQASSGCLTVQFISDGTSTFEGFAGAWECSSQPCEPVDPLVINVGATEEEIEGALSTPLTQAVITNIVCDDAAYGTFTATDNTGLGLNEGLILASGTALNALGPNNDAGGFNGTDLGTPGDADLDVLSDLFGTGEESEDACYIELEVTPNTNEVSFEYVFGSEEYPEFVNDGFNDIFAFLISGPGITGIPEIGGQDNIAVIPGTNTFVEINTVNSQINWEYYRNNENGNAIQYDGLTSDFLGVKKSLTARAEVIPCSTYQLKLAIADRGDGIYDSGVFISDLQGGSPTVDIVFNSGVEFLIEECVDVPDEIVISWNNTSGQPITYNVVLAGTAEQGVDYDLTIPSTITFPPGESMFSYPISVFADLDDNEGTENIQILLTNDFGCGLVEIDALDVELFDELVVDINAGADTVRVCEGASAQLNVTGALTYFWTPVNLFDDPTSDMPTITPTEDTWIFVEGQLGSLCSAIDSVYIDLIDPMIEITPDSLFTCQTEPVLLEAMNNSGGQGLIWAPAIGLDDPMAASTMANPQFTTTYVATLDIGAGCAVTDTVVVQVDFFNVPELNNDTTICENFGVTLGELTLTGSGTTIYAWTPEEGLDDPTSPTPTAFPSQTTTYTLNSITENGACMDTRSVTITVLPADVEINMGQDTAFLCLDDVLDLNAITTDNNDSFMWSPDDGSIVDITDRTTTATPPGFTTYFATYTNGVCTVTDSIVVMVDSLPPDMGITAEPFEEPFCEGELVTLTSPVYEPALYPNIMHQWIEIGAETSDTLYNLVLTTMDTFNYQRITTNGGCTVTEEILLEVVQVSDLAITPAFSEICPGESVQLAAVGDNLGDLTWEPANTLSCDNCPNPTATPSSTTTYNLESDVEGCSVNASATIVVLDPAAFDPIDDRTICLDGGPVALNPGFDDATSYVWTSDPPGFNSMDSNPVVNPSVTTTYTGTATNVCGSATETVTVTIIEPASLLSVGPTSTITVCEGQEFTVVADLIASGNAPSQTATWIYEGESAVGVEGTFTATNSGIAQFVYEYGTTAEDDCGRLEGSVEIIVVEAPVLSVAADTTICSGLTEPLSIFAGTVEPGVVYVWEGSDGTTFNEADPEVMPETTTTYTLSATLGECTTTDSVTINVVPSATFAIDDASSNTVLTETSVELTSIIENGDPENIDWTFMGANLGSGQSITWEPSESQTEELPNFVFATFMNACETIEDSIIIQVLQYEVPNIFSPNGDQANEVFKPFFLGEMDVVEVRVYNRWGQLVFESEDATNPGWDGTKDGKSAPTDVYIYSIRVGLGGVFEERTGQVTLVR